MVIPGPWCSRGVDRSGKVEYTLVHVGPRKALLILSTHLPNTNIPIRTLIDHSDIVQIAWIESTSIARVSETQSQRDFIDLRVLTRTCGCLWRSRMFCENAIVMVLSLYSH